MSDIANQKLENEKLRTGDDFSETQDLQSKMDENVSELNENEAIEDLKPIVL